MLIAEPSVTPEERRQILADLKQAAAVPVAAARQIPALPWLKKTPQPTCSGSSRHRNTSARATSTRPTCPDPGARDCRTDYPAAALYQRLRSSNPAPFAAFAQFGALRILSSSPGTAVAHPADGDLYTRPIAGTHPRGKNAEEDRALAAALVAHPKERAEHVMLIDLARNDLGRVCTGGSVRVDEYMAVETYAHVHHIVSNVTR